MKKLISLFSISAVFLFASCDNKNADGDNKIVLLQGWEELDLSAPETSYGMPYLINIPGKDLAKGEAQVTESSAGGTQVIAGNDFNLEILPAVGDMAAKKAEIANDGVFKITYLVDEPNLILYKSEIEGTDVAQFHFLAFVKVGNTTYEISDVKDGEFSEASIKMMVDAAKSLREKAKA